MSGAGSRSAKLTDSDALKAIWQGPFSRNALTMFVISLAVGIVAGLGAVAFRRLIGFFQNVFFYHKLSLVYPVLKHVPESVWGPGIILAPVIGGLMVVFLVVHFAPEAKGHGVPEVMDSIYYQKGRIRPVVVLIKALASSINIGSGGSIGREGPIIQMGAAFAANLSHWLRLAEWQRYALIAAGAAGGIAATFNTPAGGVLFGIELMLPEISPRTVVPVMVTTGMATYIARLFLGPSPSFIIPHMVIAATGQNNLGGFIAFIVLGVLVGLLALAFTRSIYLFEDFFDEKIGNPYLRHAVGMLLVGVIMYILFETTGHYYVQGVGYATVQAVLTKHLMLPGLLILLIGLKLFATSLTLGSGGSGGIFSPSLFMGATLGGAFAIIADGIFPGLHLDVTTAAAVGMAGLVGAGTGAVLTAVVMIAEMTHDINVLMPLVITVAVAFGVRRMITEETIYTLKLSRRGHLIPESRHSNLYLLRQAREFLPIPFTRLGWDATLRDLRRSVIRFAGTPHVLLERDDAVAGILPAHLVRDLLKGDDDGRSLSELAATDFEILSDHVTVMDVLSRRLSRHADFFIFSESGENDASEITGIVSWDDVVDEASLPSVLHARMGKLTHMREHEDPDAAEDSVAELETGRN